MKCTWGESASVADRVKNSELAVQERSWSKIVFENDSSVLRRGQMGG